MAELPWFYMDGTTRVGPIAKEELLTRLRGSLSAETLVWQHGMPKWSRAVDVVELAQFLPPPPPGDPASEPQPTASVTSPRGTANVVSIPVGKTTSTTTTRPHAAPQAASFGALFTRRFRATQWWAAGLTVLALGPAHCRKFLADPEPAGAFLEVAVGLGIAVLLNMLIFGAVLAGVLAAVDLRREAATANALASPAGGQPHFAHAPSVSSELPESMRWALGIALALLFAALIGSGWGRSKPTTTHSWPTAPATTAGNTGSHPLTPGASPPALATPSDARAYAKILPPEAPATDGERLAVRLAMHSPLNERAATTARSGFPDATPVGWRALDCGKGVTYALSFWVVWPSGQFQFVKPLAQANLRERQVVEVSAANMQCSADEPREASRDAPAQPASRVLEQLPLPKAEAVRVLVTASYSAGTTATMPRLVIRIENRSAWIVSRIKLEVAVNGVTRIHELHFEGNRYLARIGIADGLRPGDITSEDVTLSDVAVWERRPQISYTPVAVIGYPASTSP